MFRIILFLVLLGNVFCMDAQNQNFDAYKYIIVADQFDFLKSSDQYQTSSLTKFLLKKKGFEVFLSNEVDLFPEVLKANRCLALFAEVKNKSNMLTIKNTIEIKDCLGNLLYESSVGKSKIKEYKRGYQEAIRNAYNSMSGFQYSYTPKTTVEVNKEKIADKIVSKDGVQVNSTSPKLKKQKKELKKVKKVKTLPLEVLYAQEIDGGYQLVNTKPEVVFIVLKTSNPTIFIVQDKNGILYQKDAIWVLEYYQNAVLMSKKYNIKF